MPTVRRFCYGFIALLFMGGLHAADLNAQLLAAAAKGNAATVQDLLKKGADINVRDKQGKTPLLLSLTSHNRNGREIAKVLINAGADVNARDERGWSAVVHALDSPEVVRLLVEKGATVRAADLFSSVTTGLCMSFDALEKAQFDVNKPVLGDLTLLDIATKKGDSLCTAALVKLGAKPRAKPEQK
jgi:ankyrin repeat protein